MHVFPISMEIITFEVFRFVFPKTNEFIQADAIPKVANPKQSKKCNIYSM